MASRPAAQGALRRAPETVRRQSASDFDLGAVCHEAIVEPATWLRLHHEVLQNTRLGISIESGGTDG
jgi:hypothetical protein